MRPQGADPVFGVEQTHGILLRPQTRSYARSDGLGWKALYAATQREAPYEARFGGVADHLIVLHLDGPVGVSRSLGRSQTRRMIPPGGLFILPGEMDFGVRLEGELDSLHLYLRRSVVAEVAEDLGLSGATAADLRPRLGDRDPLIEQIGLSVREALHEGGATSSMYIDYLARMLAAQLLRKHSASGPRGDPAAPGALRRTQLQQALDYMEAHMSETVALTDVAAALDLSAGSFARRFKAATGLPPHQYLMRMRTERAKRLLRRNESIAQVALSCGFAHQEHLTTIFRRLTGSTPATYRRLLS